MKKALLIGINYISKPEITLNGCIDDIKNITVLRDDIDSVLPTRDNKLLRLTPTEIRSSASHLRYCFALLRSSGSLHTNICIFEEM